MGERPRLLDLFCGEGGAGHGYALAGFDVTGVDIVPRPRYPYDFVQGDALDYLTGHGHEYDAIHASPPCQRYSIATAAINRDNHPDLVEPTRRALLALGRPWVLENVPGAPMTNALMLCGSMFGLHAYDPQTDGDVVLRRHRLFDSSDLLWPPSVCNHDPADVVAGVYGGGSHSLERARKILKGGYTPSTRVRKALMGMPWATQEGVNLAIPPAYTEWIGAQLLAHLEAAA